MDGQRFDAIARGLTERATRRRVFGALFGLAAGAGALAGADDTGAAGRTCRLAGDKCVQGRQCCSGLCQTATRRSRIRRCICPAGKTECRGQCIDLGTVQNCLACGDACGAGQVCCEDGCTDIGTQDNCTACGDACNGAEDELCFGNDGCQFACFGNTELPEDGFVTTDNPPVYISGTGIEPYAYTEFAENVEQSFTVTRCVTSADCPLCSQVLAAYSNPSWEATGCGCLEWECGSDTGDGGGSGFASLSNGWGGLGFICGVTQRPKNP